MRTSSEQTASARRYYRRQAPWYDLTRWIFLFGRNELLDWISATHAARPIHLVEVGCGTGRNLRRLAARHSDWRFTGIDVSPDMLFRAAEATAPFSERVRLLEQPYGLEMEPLDAPADVVLFSYSLTLFNPGWEQALDRARQDLQPGGQIAVVDFQDVPPGFFRWWLRLHQVRIDGHLLPALRARFGAEMESIRPSWFSAIHPQWLVGGWRYFLFSGRKADKE